MASVRLYFICIPICTENRVSPYTRSKGGASSYSKRENTQSDRWDGRDERVMQNFRQPESLEASCRRVACELRIDYLGC